MIGYQTSSWLMSETLDALMQLSLCLKHDARWKIKNQNFPFFVHFICFDIHIFVLKVKILLVHNVKCICWNYLSHCNSKWKLTCHQALDFFPSYFLHFPKREWFDLFPFIFVFKNWITKLDQSYSSLENSE